MQKVLNVAIILALISGVESCKRAGHPSNANATALVAGQLKLADNSNPTVAVGSVDTSLNLSTLATGPLQSTDTTTISPVGAGQLAVGGVSGVIETLPDSKVDPTTLRLTTLSIEDHSTTQPVAGPNDVAQKVHELLIRIALVPGADYYRYYICSVTDPGDCNPAAVIPKGFTLDTHVVQDLPKGLIRIAVSPCVRAQRSTDPAIVCGPEKSTTFKQADF